jgi:predicted transcriptional regulator
MPKTHARYWLDEDLKREIEQIAAKMDDRSASYVAEKFLRAGMAEFKANLPAAPGLADGLRGKIKEIKK